MTADESTDAIIGKSVALTFLDAVDYAILGHTVRLFTANLVFNAIVKEIIVEDRGTTTVLYGDLDSKPMYYSRSAYLTYEEAEKELSELMARKKEEYQNAMTSNYYIEQFYV